MEEVLKLAEENGVIRPKDVVNAGLPRKYVYRLLKQGKLEKIGRGLYKIPGREFSESEMLVKVAKRAPDVTICLLSALRFHNMTTQNPHRIWVAIQNKEKPPKVDVPLKVVRMTGESLSEGRKQYGIDSISLNVYEPAKTVADCFKFRNRIGLDVALEALSEYRTQNLGTMSELWSYAKIDRVQNVIQPYAEAQL
ncbi:MAG: type IV toxin-antitoxin system AbiEi family antitoxin domain-containing protein [Candidatus Acetothermia bacterium]